MPMLTMLLLDERIHAYNKIGCCVVESLTSSVNKREKGNDGLDRKRAAKREEKGRRGKVGQEDKKEENVMKLDPI